MAQPSDFHTSYDDARAAFLKVCGDLDLRVDRIVIGSEGDEGDVIDVAHAGDRASPNKLIVTSGLHGIEGFCGSAAQIGFLREQAGQLGDVHAVIVHVINPAGMRAHRRVNGENVDLNRNFLDHAAVDRAMDARARIIDDWVNSPEKFQAFGALWTPAFLARLAFLGGVSALKGALAGGQFANPDGLFYGGSALQPEITALSEYLVDAFDGRRPDRLVFFDLHSGIGRYGHCQLLATAADTARAEAIFRTAIALSHDRRGALFAVRGDLLSGLMKAIACRNLCGVTFECGTGPARRTFLSLRLDNIVAQHFSGDAALRRKARARMTRAFCPDDPRWRAAYVSGAAGYLRHAVHYLST